MLARLVSKFEISVPNLVGEISLFLISIPKGVVTLKYLKSLKRKNKIILFDPDFSVYWRRVVKCLFYQGLASQISTNWGK